MPHPLQKPVIPATPQAADAGAIGRAVRAERLTAGLRIDDAAALCGVSVTVLSRLENATSAVTTKSLFKILDGLGLTLLIFDKLEISQVLATLSRQARK
jgi:transcriptional regulator with XRE-family HTH domain